MANAILFDLHGEYSTLTGAGFTHLRISGPNDDKAVDGVIFLPYWLLTYEEMTALLLDRSDQNAPNQAMLLARTVADARRIAAKAEGDKATEQLLTVDSPVPYTIKYVIDTLSALDSEMVPGKNTEKQGAFHGKLTRFIQRLEAKMADKRLKIVVATKCGFPMGKAPNDGGLSRRHIVEACEASLRRLKTDFIDLYQVHFEDRNVPLEETLAALDSLVTSGKVRYLGASNHTAYRLTKSLMLQRANGWAPYVCLQPQYSLVVRHIDREILPLCVAEGLGVIPWSPLASGFLSGKYQRGLTPPPGSRLSSWEGIFKMHGSEKNWTILEEVQRVAAVHKTGAAQVALAWMLRIPGVTSPIIGARTVDQLRKNLQAMDVKLTEDDVTKLNAVSALALEYPENFLSTMGAEE